MRRDRSERHARVRANLPALIADELPRWRRRLIERHIDHCQAGCVEELERQQQVATELAQLSEAADEAAGDAPVPDDLLDALIEQARDPGLRARAAIPARGAISGARPGMSVALVATILSLVAAAAWAGWRLGRAWSDRR